MDLLSPLLEFDQIDDLFPFSPLRELTTQHDLLPPPENKNAISKPNRKRESSNPLVEVDDIENPSDHKNKKIIHREVERQRRQEMAALNRSLRSLLPPENLKGKKSLCDHMDETVNYIRQMQKKIEELSKKGDELKRLSNKLTIYVGSKSLPSKFDGTEAGDEISKEHIQIVVSTGLNGEVALSRLLHLLIQEGLNVINSTSANFNGRLVHTIESTVTEGSSINPYELQKKLRYMVA